MIRLGFCRSISFMDVSPPYHWTHSCLCRQSNHQCDHSMPGRLLLALTMLGILPETGFVPPKLIRKRFMTEDIGWRTSLRDPFSPLESYPPYRPLRKASAPLLWSLSRLAPSYRRNILGLPCGVNTVESRYFYRHRTRCTIEPLFSAGRCNPISPRRHSFSREIMTRGTDKRKQSMWLWVDLPQVKRTGIVRRVPVEDEDEV